MCCGAQVIADHGDHGVLTTPSGMMFFVVAHHGERNAKVRSPFGASARPHSSIRSVSTSMRTASTTWTVMADPAGTEYCLTSRQPSTGTLSSSV